MASGEASATEASANEALIEATTADEDEELPLPSWGTFDYGAGFREVLLLKAIEEYLAYHHLGEPLAAFRKDVEKAGLKHKPSRATLEVLRDVEDVLLDFDAGRKEDFMTAWVRIMPPEFHAGRQGRSLELRLQAHFATSRARAALEKGTELEAEELRQDLEPFRTFLSQHGLDEVCGDEALMPLFALPFVQRPHAQPQVREIFTPSWLQELRGQVESSLRSRQPSIPLLYSIMETPAAGMESEGWQAVWAELFRIADSGLDAATMLATGTPVPPALLVEGRQRLQQLREQVPGGLELKLDSQLIPHGAASPCRSVRSRAATAPPQMPRDIDFGSLAQFIRTSLTAPKPTEPTLAAVLRAVLQRLASAEAPVAQRRGFLVSVTCFDVFGVRSHPEILPALLANSSVSELTLGILAVLACEAIGRTYIVANIVSVERLVETAKAHPFDSPLHVQALAAMQRLSLRRAPQDRMIKLGLVEWAVGMLGWPGEAIQGMPSEFSLEFGSALLMNLALRTAGKRKCVELDTLTVALNLMEHWNPQIRTHINGTLYSLLGVPTFRARARHAGLEGVLRYIHSHASSLSDDIAKKQIEYLLEQLNPQDPEATESGAESGEDDEDDDENFLEEEELAGLLLGDRSGHSAEEALRQFHANPMVAEAQHQEFRAFLSRGAMQKMR